MLVRPGIGIVAPSRALPTKRNFPDFLTAYREYTIGHEATAKVHMWTGISLLAATLERRVWLDRGYYKVFPNLYMFIIGAPGLVKKSTSTSIGVDLIRELPNINIMAERVTQASLIDTISRGQNEFDFNGEKAKQSAVYCYASELTVFMEEVAGNITDLLTTFYDCQPNDWRKPWVYETKGQGQVKIFGPCLNLLGCSTKAWLKRAVPVEAMEGGFASRVLFVIEDSLPDTFVAIPKVDNSRAAIRDKLVEDLRYINSATGPFTMTPAAEQAFTAWYEAHMRSVYHKRHNNRFAGYYGRKPTQVEKLAMIASISESNDLIVDTPHVAKALAWIEQLEKSMIEGFAASGKNILAESAISVFNFIRAHEPITETQISCQFFTELDAESLKRVLEQLRQMGQIKQESRVGGLFYRTVQGAQDIFAMHEAKTDSSMTEADRLHLEQQLS